MANVYDLFDAATGGTTTVGNVVHVRFNGESRDIPFNQLSINNVSADNDIRNALSNFFDVNAEAFSKYVVERHENGNLTVRPEAVFG